MLWFVSFIIGLVATFLFIGCVFIIFFLIGAAITKEFGEGAFKFAVIPAAIMFVPVIFTGLLITATYAVHSILI